MKEGRGEGGEKPPSPEFGQKTLQPLNALTLKRANAMRKPCHALLSQAPLWHLNRIKPHWMSRLLLRASQS